MAIVTPLLVSALALDLIYLFISGKWYDQLVIVEVAEIVVLPVLVVFGIYRAVMEVRRLKTI
jgi:hypothetical protein